ncbi:hypothetical protein R5W24_003363 [Gemmata sp. JC717]|uniref:hypothetical protein n=1 Tax=Gemmata algarum TaxID=2975278 RepID=UPI0021BB1B45|nr:hypothetical protein [Gemmata algarum]MDY3554244.1 hypothetical protein [Gemmata algarum]
MQDGDLIAFLNWLTDGGKTPYNYTQVGFNPERKICRGGTEEVTDEQMVRRAGIWLEEQGRPPTDTEIESLAVAAVNKIKIEGKYPRQQAA